MYSKGRAIAIKGASGPWLLQCDRGVAEVNVGASMMMRSAKESPPAKILMLMLMGHSSNPINTAAHAQRGR